MRTLAAHRWLRRWMRSLRPARIPLGLPLPMLLQENTKHKVQGERVFLKELGDFVNSLQQDTQSSSRNMNAMHCYSAA
jgi:hypothetical protein